LACHATCAQRSVPGLSSIKSINGKPHFVLLDPNGVLVEVGPASRPVSSRVGARFAGVAMSVPDLDVAFGFRDAHQIRAAWQRRVQGGFKPNAGLVSSAGQVVVGYLNDPQGFNVELLMVRPWLDGVMGFRRETSTDKVLKRIMMALA
jgi:hypothetical protein